MTDHIVPSPNRVGAVRQVVCLRNGPANARELRPLRQRYEASSTNIPKEF